MVIPMEALGYSIRIRLVPTYILAAKEIRSIVDLNDVKNQSFTTLP